MISLHFQGNSIGRSYAFIIDIISVPGSLICPYNLLYATFRVLFQCTIRSKLYNNFMSCHGTPWTFPVAQNVITDFLIVRNNKSKCFTLLVCSDHLFYLMLKNLDNLALTSLISMFFLLLWQP